MSEIVPMLTEITIPPSTEVISGMGMVFNISSASYYPIVNAGETKTGFCLRECFNEIGSEVLRAIEFDMYTILFLISLAIGGGIFRYYLFKKIDKELKNTYGEFKNVPKEFKMMKFYITMTWFISCVLSAIVLKFRMGFIGLGTV